MPSDTTSAAVVGEVSAVIEPEREADPLIVMAVEMGATVTPVLPEPSLIPEAAPMRVLTSKPKARPAFQPPPLVVPEFEPQYTRQLALF